MIYDIIYIGEDSSEWRILKSRFPTAKKASSLEKAQKMTFTKMFWVVTPDVIVCDDFDFSFEPDEWSKEYTHVFKNGEYYDGIILCNKRANISKKEFEYRFYRNKKEIDIQASIPKPYEIFTVDSYEDYCEAYENSSTSMFWMVPSDVEVVSDFDFSYRVAKWDEQFHLVFKNGNYYDGVVLCTKQSKLSKNEIDYRFYRNKKEIDIQASMPKPYDIFYADGYDDYKRALEQSTTKMFWLVWNDVDILDEFDFSFQPDEASKNYVHVFKNGEYYDGIILCSRDSEITQREIDYRFYRNKKEIDIQASMPKPYDIFNINTYEDYQNALEKSKTDMFWIIWPGIKVNDDFDFNWYFSHHNSYDRKQNHAFKNGKYFDGIVLASKHAPITRREVEFRFVINRKEVDYCASMPKPYDIVFISYKEPNAEKNYHALLERFPRTKRVHNVKGIHNAHIKAAGIVDTDMFWVVDGDAEIEKDFNFDYQVAHWDKDCVHVWRSKNPVNDLTYGYGGVKLLPTELTKNVDINSTDMTTSISYKFKAVPEVSNVTAFDTDPFSTWRSAFRECAKLASSVIRGQIDDETKERLDKWCNTDERRSSQGAYARRGAIHGREFGLSIESSVQLGKINDFEWLYERFLEENKTSE
jgi:hypothetical protein